jgi:hypothetical protein
MISPISHVSYGKKQAPTQIDIDQVDKICLFLVHMYIVLTGPGRNPGGPGGGREWNSLI